MRISGRVLPINKRITIALRYLRGVGPTLAKQICVDLDIDESIRVKDLSPEIAKKIEEYIDEKEWLVEDNLKNYVTLNIRRYISNGSYRGKRHRLGLPVRGQNTKTNAKTTRKRVKKG